METTLLVRIILIILSMLSIVLQIVGVAGRAWFGFTITIDIAVNQQHLVVKESMDSGLFHLTPLQVCADFENGTECNNSPDDFPPSMKPMISATTKLIDKSITRLRFMCVTGVLLCGPGLILLFLYLCRQSKLHRCMGITCSVMWFLSAIFELIAVGIQISNNKDSGDAIQAFKTMNTENMQITGKFITAWSPIVLGIGAFWSLVVGLIVAMTTCGKKFSKTVIIYRELRAKEEQMLDDDEE